MRKILLVWVACGAIAHADVVAVKGSKKVTGRVVSEDATTVVVNQHNSTLDDAVAGRVEIPAAKVKSIKRTFPTAEREFQARLRKILIEAAPGEQGASAFETFDDDGAGKEDEDAAARRIALAKRCVELAKWANEKKLKHHKRYAFEIAWRLDPRNADARKGMGSVPKHSWASRMKLAREFLAAENPESVWSRIKIDSRFPFTRAQLDRARRSQKQKKGYQEHRPITMRADTLEAGAKYTLYVPDSYDPLKPTPLVVGLHGGGPGGADGKGVVGNGAQAMPFYQRLCEERGWICVCPNAVRAGWGGKLNDAMMDAMLDELLALYHIDEARMYLVGHSMGGGGSWVQGTRLAERWAAIAPAASYGVRGIPRLDKTGTGFYVYHSDDDPRTGIGGVRPHMENLLGSKIDYVYSELKGRGHSFPRHVVVDIFRWFEPRTLSIGRGRPKPAVRPISSFRRKVTRDEKKYLPAFDVGQAVTAVKLSTLLKKLKTGGGVAKAAVEDLAKHPDPKTNSRVASAMLKADTPDVRRYAAQVLGERKAKGQIGALGKVLTIETDADALLSAIEALRLIGDGSAASHITKFLKVRVDYLHDRKRGQHLDNTDWSNIIPTLAHACRALGAWKDGGGAPAIASQVLGRVFLGDLTVIYDRQNQRPLPVARDLARAASEALQRLGDRSVADTLAKARKAAVGNNQPDIEVRRGPIAIIGGWLKDAEIRAHIEAADRELSKP